MSPSSRVSFAALFLVALPWTAAAAPPPAAACRLLADPAAAGRMGGLHFHLARRCGGFASAFGGETGAPPPIGDGLAAGRTDAAVNDPGLDQAAAFGSHSQSHTALARSGSTGTFCAGYDDSYHLLTEGLGFSGFSRAPAGPAGPPAFADRGALGAAAGGEPSLAWRRVDGFFYYAALHDDGLGLWRSQDDCLSFSFVGLIYQGSAADKERLAADGTPSSPFFGRLYAVYTDFTAGAIEAVASSDGGATWSAPVAVSAGGEIVQGAFPAVASNGDLYVAYTRWQSFPDGPIDIRLARSVNGGATFAAAQPPAGGKAPSRDAAASASCGRPALAGPLRSLPTAQLAVSADGVLHVVYGYDPDGLDQGDVADVFYRRSTTGGASWGPELRVGDGLGAADQFGPALAVEGRNVAVSFYDRRLDPGNLLLDRFLRLSTDGGLSWAPARRLSDVSSPVRLDPQLATCYHGDDDQLAAAPDFALASWSDDRHVQDGHADADVFAEVEPLPLFADGFESGGAGAWSVSVP